MNALLALRASIAQLHSYFNLPGMFDDLEAGLLDDDEPFERRVSSGEVGIASNENSFAWSSPYISLSVESASSESIQPAAGPPVHVPTYRDVEQWVQRHIDDANERLDSVRRGDESSARVLRRRKGRWEVVLPLALLPTSPQPPQSPPSTGHSRSIYLGKFATLEAAGRALRAAVHHALGAAFPHSHWASLNASSHVASSFTGTSAQSAGFAVARNLRSSRAWAASPPAAIEAQTTRGALPPPPATACKSTEWHSLCARACDSLFPEVFAWLQPGPWPPSATRIRRQSSVAESATESQSSSMGFAGIELWMRVRNRMEHDKGMPGDVDENVPATPGQPAAAHHQHPHCVTEGSPSPPRLPGPVSSTATVGFAAPRSGNRAGASIDLLGRPPSSVCLLGSVEGPGSSAILRWYLPAPDKVTASREFPLDDGESDASERAEPRTSHPVPRTDQLGIARKGALRRLAGWQSESADGAPVASPTSPALPSGSLPVAELAGAAGGRSVQLRVPLGWADASLFGRAGVSPLQGCVTASIAGPPPLDVAAAAKYATNGWCSLLERENSSDLSVSSSASSSSRWFVPACAWEPGGRRAAQLVAATSSTALRGEGLCLEENGAGVQLGSMGGTGGSIPLLHWSAKQTRLWRALAPTTTTTTTAPEMPGEHDCHRGPLGGRETAEGNESASESESEPRPPPPAPSPAATCAEGSDGDAVVTKETSNEKSMTKPRPRRKNPLRFRQMQATLPRFRDIPATATRPAAKPPAHGRSVSSRAARKPVSVTTVTGDPGMRVFDWHVADPPGDAKNRVVELSGVRPSEKDVWLRMTVWAPFAPVQAATMAYLQWEAQRLRASKAASS